MNNYIYSIIISKLDTKSMVSLAETNREMYYLIRKSNYAGILWNNYFNKLKKTSGDITNIKDPEEIFKLCALEKFKYEKNNTTKKYLTQYFYYLTNKQIELYLNSKNVYNYKCQDLV